MLGFVVLSITRIYKNNEKEEVFVVAKAFESFRLSDALTTDISVLAIQEQGHSS